MQWSLENRIGRSTSFKPIEKDWASSIGDHNPKQEKQRSSRRKSILLFQSCFVVNIFRYVKAKFAAKPCLPRTPSDDRLDIRKFAAQPARYSTNGSTQKIGVNHTPPPPFLSARSKHNSILKSLTCTPSLSLFLSVFLYMIYVCMCTYV